MTPENEAIMKRLLAAEEARKGVAPAIELRKQIVDKLQLARDKLASTQAMKDEDGTHPDGIDFGRADAISDGDSGPDGSRLPGEGRQATGLNDGSGLQDDAASSP